MNLTKFFKSTHTQSLANSQSNFGEEEKLIDFLKYKMSSVFGSVWEISNSNFEIPLEI